MIGPVDVNLRLDERDQARLAGTEGEALRMASKTLLGIQGGGVVCVRDVNFAQDVYARGGEVGGFRRPLPAFKARGKYGSSCCYR